MKALLAVVIAMTAPATLPPKVAALIEPPVACYVDGINPTVVCVDRNGKKSWIA